MENDSTLDELVTRKKAKKQEYDNALQALDAQIERSITMTVQRAKERRKLENDLRYREDAIKHKEDSVKAKESALIQKEKELMRRERQLDRWTTSTEKSFFQKTWVRLILIALVLLFLIGIGFAIYFYYDVLQDLVAPLLERLSAIFQ